MAPPRPIYLVCGWSVIIPSRIPIWSISISSQLKSILPRGMTHDSERTSEYCSVLMGKKTLVKKERLASALKSYLRCPLGSKTSFRFRLVYFDSEHCPKERVHSPSVSPLHSSALWCSSCSLFVIRALRDDLLNPETGEIPSPYSEARLQ